MFFGEYDPNGYSDDDRQPVGGFDIPDTSTGVRVSYTCHDNHERLYCELEADALVDDYVRYSNVQAVRQTTRSLPKYSSGC
jgi:hypothetical protein